MADFYTASGDPAQSSSIDSSVIRAEYSLIATGFTKVAGYTGAANRVVHINSGATSQTTTTGFTFDGTTFTAPALAVTNNSTLTGNLAVNGGNITSTATTFNLLNATVTTLNIGGAATTVALGAATGTVTVGPAIVGSIATDSTSPTTGAWKTAGGLGVAKALWVGGLANIAGNFFAGGGSAEIGNAANAGIASFYNGAGGTSYQTLEIASNRADSNGGTVARLEFSSNSNSATYKTLAALEASHQGTTANQRGGQINFYTRPDGSTTLTQRGYVHQNGTLNWLYPIVTDIGHATTVGASTSHALTIGTVGVPNVGDLYGIGLGLQNAYQPVSLYAITTSATGYSIADFVIAVRTATTDTAPTTILRCYAGGGITVGAPTGGDKGVGAINIAGDIYKNNTAYTNPDYVLEHWATGKIEKFADQRGAREYPGLMPLEEVERIARENFCLPGFGQLAKHGLFEGSDKLLAVLEEAYIHLFDQQRRIAALEARLP